eukprot:TRINITY_DN4932_c0_g1_i2.p1 TRINITY_DN4932_c0_g1~~TRINITY_DN4932_c0_g1_i2.p1  ORF type:complete len:224 (+),score=19.19 TRINITY_DN4932_c0_g1_i2:416-1087(+)
MCDLESAYDNVIGPLLADYEIPKNESTSHIKYFSTFTSFTVAFSDMKLRDQDITLSFAVTLYLRGGITFYFLNVPQLPSENRLSGVRGPFQADVYEHNAASWNTNVNGSYPLPSWIQTNSTVRLCPLGVYFCSSPRSGPESGNNTLYIWSNDYTCLTLLYLNFSCWFRQPTEMFNTSYPPRSSPYLTSLKYDSVKRLLYCPIPEIGRAVQQECRDRSRMPSSA